MNKFFKSQLTVIEYHVAFFKALQDFLSTSQQAAGIDFRINYENKPLMSWHEFYLGEKSFESISGPAFPLPGLRIILHIEINTDRVQSLLRLESSMKIYFVARFSSFEKRNTISDSKCFLSIQLKLNRSLMMKIWTAS